jgi:hypothetical protein
MHRVVLKMVWLLVGASCAASCLAATEELTNPIDTTKSGERLYAFYVIAPSDYEAAMRRAVRQYCDNPDAVRQSPRRPVEASKMTWLCKGKAYYFRGIYPEGDESESGLVCSERIYRVSYKYYPPILLSYEQCVSLVYSSTSSEPLSGEYLLGS